MRLRTSTWTRALALGAATCLSLTACGGLDFGRTSEPEPKPAEEVEEEPTEEEEEPTEEEPTEDEDEAEDDADDDSSASGGTVGNADVTAPGTELKIGEAAVVTVDYAYEQGNVEIKPTEITKGDEKDLEELDLGDQAAGFVPYYITVEVTGADESAKNLEYASVDGDLEAILPDGSRAQSVIVFGTWDKCPSESAPKDFDAGVSFETCVLGLASGSAEVTGLQYRPGGDSPYYEEPIIWKK